MKFVNYDKIKTRVLTEAPSHFIRNRIIYSSTTYINYYADC